MNDSGANPKLFDTGRFALAICGSLGAALCLSPLVPAQAEILIGQGAPLTGGNSWIGEQVTRGAELAIADINRAGGVLGEKLRLIAADDFCEPEQAVAAAEQLVAAGVAFVGGHMCSGSSIAAAEVYEQARIVMISPGSTSPKLTEMGRSNVFRVCGRDDRQGTIAGDYLAQHWSDKNIAILDDGGVYGHGLAEETKKALNGHGVTEVMRETFPVGEDDYSDLVERLQAASVDVLYIGGYVAEAALILRTARDAGLDVQLVAGDGLATDSFWQITGEAGEGTLITFFPDPTTNPSAGPVVERFRASGFEPLGYTLWQYAAVQAWAQAAQAAGSLELEPVLTALHGSEFDTVLGPLQFDAKGDNNLPNFVWYVWKDGEFVRTE